MLKYKLERGAKMIEIPECITIAKQMNETIAGKAIKKVIANHSPHKFAFYFGEPDTYSKHLVGKRVDTITPLAGYVEVSLGTTIMLFGDGVNIRYFPNNDSLPPKHQLLVEFDDLSVMVCTVQMYGGMWVFTDGENDNPYYIAAKQAISPLSDKFDKIYFMKLLNSVSGTSSVKAFLATEQRIPGLGNGVLQDILFNARINPKSKIKTLSDVQIDNLFESVKYTLRSMAILGGRDTEKDFFGNFGGYATKLSNKTYKKPCPVCGREIIRQPYLGGSIYFCPTCQPV